MNDEPAFCENSAFISLHAPFLLDRFRLSYRFEFSSADYFIADIATGRIISKDILFFFDRLKHHVVVSRFYPELSKQDDAKYLSATCFFLMIHHFRRVAGVSSGFDIQLNATPSTFSGFYDKLKDFNFTMQGSQTDDYVQCSSVLNRSGADTSMIRDRGIHLGG